MKRKKTIWGIFLVAIAVVLLFYALLPKFTIFGHISTWKLIAGAFLIYWMLKNIFCGDTPEEQLSIFLPLALLFVVFRNDIAHYIWAGAADVKLWLVIVAAIVLTAAVSLFTENKSLKKSAAVDGEARENAHKNTCASAVQYLDANLPSHWVKNRIGETTVYFQNTDIGDLTRPIRLTVENELGQVTVHVPADWTVHVESGNSLGEIENRVNLTENGRLFTLCGYNRLGEIDIVSP